MIFRNWVLQNFPFLEDDFDALTDYELFCKMVEYMKKSLDKVLEYQDELNEFRTELDSYKNYFDNLDVQEEINNKLDEMAESGELADIIAQYLQLAGVLVFSTVSDMKSATNIVNGSVSRTLGYTTYNDKQGSYYKIRTITNDDIVDEYNIISLTDDTLIAEKINNNNLIVFDTVQDMVASKLLSGNCICYGYYEKGDNIPVMYEIKSTGTADYGSVLQIASGKYAHAILNGGVTPETFGIKESLTDVQSITRWDAYVSYVNTNQNVHFELMGKTYTIYKPIVVGCEFKGQGQGRTILKAGTNIQSKSITIEDTSSVEHTESHTCLIYLSNYDVINNELEVHHLTLDCDSKAQCGIFQGNGALYNIHDLYIKNSTVDGIRVITGWQCSYKNIVIDITQGTGFEFGDTYDTASGTTFNLQNIHVQGFNTAYTGYVMYQLQYSTLIDCSCDNCYNGYAYYFNKCNSISGNIGCEYIATNKSCLHIEDSNVNFNFLTVQTTINNPDGYSDIIELYGDSYAILNVDYPDSAVNVGGLIQLNADSNIYVEASINNDGLPQNTILQGTLGTTLTAIVKRNTGFYYANDSLILTKLQ